MVIFVTIKLNSMLHLGLLLLVALLWGATNPFLNKGSVGVEAVKGSGLRKKIGEIVFLATKWSVSRLDRRVLSWYNKDFITVHRPVSLESNGKCPIFRHLADLWVVPRCSRNQCPGLCYNCRRILFNGRTNTYLEVACRDPDDRFGNHRLYAGEGEDRSVKFEVFPF